MPAMTGAMGPANALETQLGDATASLREEI